MIALPFLLLAATMYLTAILVSNLNSLWETSIQNFSFMIIFPVGAAAVAALAVSGLYFGRWIGKLTFKRYYLWIALVAGAMSFFAVTYMDYRHTLTTNIAKVESSNGVKFTAEELKDIEKEAPFTAYLENIYKNSTIQISSRRRSKSVEINNEIVSIISFWASVIGAVGGAYFAHTLAVGERTKAKKEHRDLKYRATLDYDLFDEIKKRISDKKVDRAFIEFLNENNIKTRAQNICVVRILKARTEGDGQIIAEQKAMNGKNQTVVNSAELSLDEAQIDKLIEDIKMFVPKEKF